MNLNGPEKPDVMASLVQMFLLTLLTFTPQIIPQPLQHYVEWWWNLQTELSGVHLATEEVSLTWPLAKSPNTDTTMLGSPPYSLLSSSD